MDYDPNSNYDSIDYMSNEYVVSNNELAKKRKPKEPIKLSKKAKAIQLKELMKRNLDEVSSIPVSSSSIGSKLLYTFGDTGEGGLGKDSQGIQSPIIVNESWDWNKKMLLDKELENQKYMENRSKLLERSESEFKSNTIAKFNIIQMGKDLTKIETIIRDLDIKSDLSYHNLWPNDEELPSSHLDSKLDPDSLAERLLACLKV